MNQKAKFEEKGFTIIELAIATSILAVIFGGMTIFGVQIIKGYKRSQVLKDTVENTSYAIESLNKTIRTSNHISDGGDEVFIIDNNTGNSYCYRFDSTDNSLERAQGVGSDTKCGDLGGFSKLAGGNGVEVDGSFKIKETDRSNNKRGFVRTKIEISYPVSGYENFENDQIIIQSSISLRDYGFYFPP